MHENAAPGPTAFPGPASIFLTKLSFLSQVVFQGKNTKGNWAAVLVTDGPDQGHCALLLEKTMDTTDGTHQG